MRPTGWKVICENHPEPLDPVLDEGGQWVRTTRSVFYSHRLPDDQPREATVALADAHRDCPGKVWLVPAGGTNADAVEFDFASR